MKGPRCQEHYGRPAARHPGEGRRRDSETRKRNTEERTCQLRTTADLLVRRLMRRCLTGDPCTVGHAHVRAVTGHRVRVQTSDIILIGEYMDYAEQSAYLAVRTDIASLYSEHRLSLVCDLSAQSTTGA